MLNLTTVASLSSRWKGVAVSNTNRIFTSFPNASDANTVSVTEMINGVMSPYPNEDWNTASEGMDPSTHFICVSSVFIDHNNFLWVVDAANIQRNGVYQGIVPGGAKIIKIDLENNSIVKTIVLSEPTIKQTSYLNDIRIDEIKNIGYLTDSNEGAIIVVDLENGTSRRLLQNDPSTKSENIVINVDGVPFRNEQGEYPVIHSRGIALSADGSTLYWRSLTAKSLYKIETKYLLEEETESDLSSKIIKVGEFPPSDGMIFGKDGLLYMTSVEDDAVRVLMPDCKIATQRFDLLWPASLSVGADGSIYVITSQLNVQSPSKPYNIFKFHR